MSAPPAADQPIRLALREAIDQARLFLNLQPIVDACGRTVSFEALARWTHGPWGPIEPARFIRIAEESGWIAEIDEHVLIQVCTLLATWRAQGIPTLPIAVNVSAASVRSARFAERTRDILDRYQVGRHEVEFEITETCALVRNETLVATMNALRSRGVKLVLDDFGAGYASMSSLVNLPFSRLKIDRFLVRGVDGHDSKRSIVRAIVDMAAALRLGLVAEGVQTLEEWRVLRRLGCEKYQGFLFGLPCPVRTWEERLQGRGREDVPVLQSVL